MCLVGDDFRRLSIRLPAYETSTTYERHRIQSRINLGFHGSSAFFALDFAQKMGVVISIEGESITYRDLHSFRLTLPLRSGKKLKMWTKGHKSCTTTMQLSVICLVRCCPIPPTYVGDPPIEAHAVQSRLTVST